MSYSTRSKTGHTPRKPENPGFVETPGARARPRGRKSLAPESDKEDSPAPTNGHVGNGAVEVDIANGSAKAANGHSKSSNGVAKSGNKKNVVEDYKVDNSGVFEFGGPIGVVFLMAFFPLLMYYLWIGATYYDGQFPWPMDGQSPIEFLQHLVHLAYTGAFPHAKAWAMYWGFFIFEALCYIYMPGGVYAEGKPLAHLGGQKLRYYCSGVPSFWTTIVVALGLHFTGIFPMWNLMDEFGPVMSVAIITGIAISFIAYFSAIARGATHRMTGYPTYDFFMGAELNPRMLGWLDFKMFFEVRLPWFILFLTTLSGCLRQYEQYGYISGEMVFLLMAHWLYANACCKAEDLIPPTWDIYYEKWGFMLIFWNLAGVPLTYCHCSIYLANHDPATYRWNRYFLAFLYVSYLFWYWVWDSCGSQKSYFRASQRGTIPTRNTFPQMPWRRIENPQTIPVENGDDLLCDGWYKYARKIHYTADVYFAICWALVTGFGSPIPWFYPVFFVVMIAHRAQRDIHKCRERYGKAWEEFERRTPYLFIPVSTVAIKEEM